MINILSYVGMSLQSEVCLWCLLGLVRTIFDATLFKVNANLKQVWHMNMPGELSMPVQRALRTMVSGIMLVQCFTVYVYLAAYIVILYPVFLEERPTLVLPWLLLAAVRKLLCELMSLALGLGTCLLLGPAKPPCIKFVIVKFASIVPIFYMWMLVFSYYHALKVATAFKTFPAVLPPNDDDYGLELAVRRRRTKSLLGEDQLRKKLVASFYREGTSSITEDTYLRTPLQPASGIVGNSADTNIEEEGPESDVTKPLPTGWSDIGAYEDWFGSEIIIPRDTDRILEQIVLMLLRVGVYLRREGKESIVDSQIINSALPASWHQRDNISSTAMNGEDTETPTHISSSKGNMASYLREYPQIFMKKQANGLSQTELTLASLKAVHSLVEANEGTISKHKVKLNSPSKTSCETIAFVEFDKVPSKRKIKISNSSTTPEDKTLKLTLPSQLQTKRTAKEEEKNNKSKHKKQRAPQQQAEKYVIEFINKIIDDFREAETSADNYNKASDNKRTIKANFTTSNVGNDTKYSENGIPQQKENNNDKFMSGTISIARESLIQSKILNSDISKEASDITMLNQTTNRESVFSVLNEKSKEQLSEEDIKLKISDSCDNILCTRCVMSNKASSETILKENINLEHMFSETLNVTYHEKIFNDGEISKADSGIEISNRGLTNRRIWNRVKQPTGAEILKEDSKSNVSKNIKKNENNNFNSDENKRRKEDNNNEFMYEEILNKEFPLRILSNDVNVTDSLDGKVSNKDLTDAKISPEVKHENSTDRKKYTEANPDCNTNECVSKNCNKSEEKN